MVDRITLNLVEKPSGPSWNLKVEGDKIFFLLSNELILNLNPKRPMIRFTSSGMTTICPQCGVDVRYGVQGKFLNWWCEGCGFHRIDSV